MPKSREIQTLLGVPVVKEQDSVEGLPPTADDDNPPLGTTAKVVPSVIIGGQVVS